MALMALKAQDGRKDVCTMTYVEIARRVIQARAVPHLIPQPVIDKLTEPVEEALGGRTVELWSTAAGRLFLVADESDAVQAVERFGPHRGEIYTMAEARRIVAVKDPAVVAEIRDWKKRFDGVVREIADTNE